MNEINLPARLAQGLLAVTIVFVIGLGLQMTILYEGGKFMQTHRALTAITTGGNHGLPHTAASRFS
ncbi:MAG TPA: hypothetical protein VGO37_08300 [Steroidobacteraceae bacterium]|jgi:hypothetical protein|nr:hypothetical protein [Steroidobacteraceae bacterium]